MRRKRNIGGGERAVSGLAGSAFLLLNRTRGGLVWGALGIEFLRRAISGRSFFYRALGVDTRRPESFTHFYEGGFHETRRSVTVNRPRREVYNCWSNEWTSEVIEEIPDEWVSWRTAAGSKLILSGNARFVDAPANQGTELHAHLRYRVPGGKLGWALSKVLGRDPDQQLRVNLRRFKKIMETGEIITVEGQPSGRLAA